MLRCLPRLTLFNRNDLVPHIRSTILASTTHIHVVTGPRSCGKTRTMEEAMEAAPFVVNVSCRSQDITDRDLFYRGFRRRFDEAAERTTKWQNYARATAIIGSKTVREATGIPIPDLKEIGEVLAGVGKTDNSVFEELDAAIQKIHAKRGRLVIYIDELNIVQSKGDPEFKWRDTFTQGLMGVLIRNTKEGARATAVLSTSDQQYAALMNGKADFQTHCLGYMGVKEIDEFLKIDWEGDPTVEKEEDRQKIIDSNGGFFPGLALLRRAAKDGRLDETIEKMQGETNRGLDDRLYNVPDEMRVHCKAALKSVGEQGYRSYRELCEAIGKGGVKALIDQNLVQLRYMETGHEGALWAPDLPEAARSIDVVTPYLPIDRKWLREL